MGKYLLNKETQKIEMHFDKSEYLALSEDQKKEIKSNFLWSKTAGAWVSRSIHYHGQAVRIAEKLGLENAGKIGERLSYEEELNRKAERAENRAERYEEYAENAEKRGANLQKEMNSMRGDIAFFTQPIIAGHSGSQAFKRRRDKIFDRYFKGFEEYRKSDYFKERAETARATADQTKLKNPVYLHNRIKECNSTIKKLEGNIIHYEELIERINNGHVLKSIRTGEPLTAEYYQGWIDDTLDRVEYEIDKLAFLENCLSEIGGLQFSNKNIKPGYVVQIQKWGRCEIITAGTVNVTYKILDGGASGGVLTDPYAAIVKIIAVKEAEKIVNPYNTGDILCMHRPADSSIYRAYQVIKVTETGVKLQQIKVENGVPVANEFISDKQTQKKVVKSKFSDYVGVYMDDRQLHKYQAKEA
ncbi:MAG: DUF3560 domain-containing protein [Clostridiales bacterium]|jgi:hypothetical protein|nr:DUF3560 domain-containing protein [Clostridiales bacterium]